jgi:hypothetical protein
METLARVPSLPVSGGEFRRPDGQTGFGQAVRVVEAEAGRHIGPRRHRSAVDLPVLLVRRKVSSNFKCEFFYFLWN